MWVSIVLAAFVFTQLVYAAVNLCTAIFVYPRSENPVTEATVDDAGARTPPQKAVTADGGSSHGTKRVTDDFDPTRGLSEDGWPDVYVLCPIYGETPDVLVETVDGIYEQTYPSEAITVYIIYETDDDGAPPVVERLERFRENGYDVRFVCVDRDALAADRSGGHLLLSGEHMPRTKAAALTYAFMTGSFDAEDVITVFDSDTQVPRDTFRLAVAGLDTYDIVQAKQTVRNIDDGVLPFLEASGIAAWSDRIYAKTAGGPYQLLGKAYFTDARTIEALDEWQLDAATEDMALGMAAFQRGYTLGVLDRYVHDLCPSRPRDWIRQKRRWVRGPYSYCVGPGLSPTDRVRFVTATICTQLVAVTTVFGLPAGLLVALAVVVGTGVSIPDALWPVLVLNAVGWLYYGLLSMHTARDVLAPASLGEWVGFVVSSNPLSQAIYAMTWSVPIALAVADSCRAIAPSFVVTPKE